LLKRKGFLFLSKCREWIGVEKGTGDKLLSQYQTNERFHKFDGNFGYPISQNSSILFFFILADFCMRFLMSGEKYRWLNVGICPLTEAEHEWPPHPLSHCSHMMYKPRMARQQV
jgi:hypothetical protein